MAQNRRSDVEAPHPSSDEEEEEEEEGSSEDIEEREGSELESEEEEQEDKTLPPTPPVNKKPSVSKKPETTQAPAKPQSSSSDDSGSESDSESDAPPEKSRRADPNIKPIASKPMEVAPKSAKKPRSKPSVPPSPTPAKSAKRLVESEAKDSRRVKRKLSDVDDGVSEGERAKKTTGDDSKKQLFQRLWSEDDEIAILKGMIEYTAKKGADPVADMHAFHDFIKKSLHVDVSKTQLSDKVRRLKKKYANNASKGKKGEDRTFTKPHEQKAYELSKKIWGGEASSVGVDNTKVNGNARKNQNHRSSKALALPKAEGLSSPDGQKEVTEMEVERNVTPSRSFRFSRTIGDSSLEEEIINEGLELIAGPKRLELEEKWKKLRVQEIELYLKRVQLIGEQTKLFLEALKSSGH